MAGAVAVVGYLPPIGLAKNRPIFAAPVLWYSPRIASVQK
ncbi:MAG: hypothetical protein KatS3mg105_4571 [Gemmatales bacterium]|nr:MAG: hypothetical protein KatS3mg105_4571 [Gemmatales bacterium]